MFKELYKEVQGIVYKSRNEYYLHLWELSDWDQEGMICLHELLENHPDFKKNKIRNFIPTSKQSFEIEFWMQFENKKVIKEDWIDKPMKK